jgi:hypothetical protein
MNSAKISEGLFFPEDFKKLPKNAILFIKTGLLIIPDAEG